jgi:hypothetical protein
MKQKLTLSVEKELVEKAKKLGINISEVTEIILKAYTSTEQPKGGSLYDAYQQLFDSITPLMKEFDIEDIYIGAGEEYHGADYDLLLLPSGSFYLASLAGDEFDIEFKDIRKIEYSNLCPPKDILDELAKALVRTDKARKEKRKEILMVKRIVDAITESLVEKESPTTNIPFKKEKKP